MFDRIDHVIIAVPDVSAATADYEILLGRSPSWRGEHPGAGTANSLFRLGNGYLELLGPHADAGAGASASRDAVGEHLRERGEGLFGLALRCADASACARELRERGLDPSDPVEGAGREASSGLERRWRNVYLPPPQTRGVILFAIEHLTPEDVLARAPALAAESSCIDAFDHVVVMTRDADAARGLYEDGLGIRMALDRKFEKFGTRLVYFRLGGVSIEIGTSLKHEPDSTIPDQLWGLAYRVADLGATRERLDRSGLDVSEVRKGRKPGTLVCTVRSRTHGVATLLIGPDPKPTIPADG